MFLAGCNLCGRFFAMAAKKSKPLPKSGGWLGVDTGTSDTTAKADAGGGQMEAVRAELGLGAYAVGVGAAATVGAGVAAVVAMRNPMVRRNLEDAAFVAKRAVRDVMPVSGKTARNLRKDLAQARLAKTEAELNLQDERLLARQPDTQYMKLFNQSMIMEDATKLARELPIEMQTGTRSSINRALQKGAEYPFGKTAEDIASDVRLTNRYLREKGKFVSKRLEMLKRDPEFRQQINDALLRQQAKTNARKVVDEAMRNITNQSIRKLQGPK